MTNLKVQVIDLKSLRLIASEPADHVVMVQFTDVRKGGTIAVTSSWSEAGTNMSPYLLRAFVALASVVLERCEPDELTAGVCRDAVALQGPAEKEGAVA